MHPIDAVIAIEGGYVNHPHDRGGPTKYGITEAVARRHGYSGDMMRLTVDFARRVYRADYWDRIAGDDLPPAIAAEVFDTAVNMGAETAAKFLQRALNALTPHTLAIDGAIGPATLAALDTYLKTRDEKVLLAALNGLQAERYITLTESRPENKSFVYGWLKQRVTL